MQAQRLRTQTKHITSTQSLASVQTLLKAGLGCIAFLRNLLPEDNFTESLFVTDTPESQQCSLDTSISTDSSSSNRRNADGFKIITMARGYTDEADKLLDYLELGVFDALEKRYLKSFIFAIYLDNKDPNNIIEAYTFDFQYYKISGSDDVVPLLSLGKDFQSLSLRNRPMHKDPIAEAVRKGDTPTLKDVKRSVLLKTLIHVMSQMDNLPRRRYATFKLLYTDETPADYEPPCFKPGDFQRDKWYFMTHTIDEVPDKWNVGKLRTGYHSVNLNVTSISTYLPASAVNDRTTAKEYRTGGVSNAISGVQKANVCSWEAEEQALDAESRNIVWAADPTTDLCDEDADGEVDTEYVKHADGRYERIITAEEPSTYYNPVGIRNSNGVIEPMSDVHVGQECEDQFPGVSETVPTCLKDITGQIVSKQVTIEETQPLIISAQETSNTCQVMNDHYVCTSPTQPSPPSAFSSMANLQSNDTEMIDFETQVEPCADESIQTFTSHTSLIRRGRAASLTGDDPHTKKIDHGLQCDCGVSSKKGDSCFCEGDCKRWYHVWCMGFHSVNDARIPARFICFDCRVHRDISWELVKIDIYPQMLAKYRELALFRRAIKTAEMIKPFTVAEFSRSFGGDQSLARQLINRLEAEEFISKNNGLEDLELSQKVTGRKTKVKATKARNYVLKRRYAFHKPAKNSTRYRDYFDPDSEVENRLLNLSNLISKRRQILPEAHPTANYLKTDGARVLGVSAHFKRSVNDMDSDAEGIKKKVKISVTTGIDLAE